MRRREMMTAGGVTLAGLGVLVGLAVGSSGNGQQLIAQRTQPVEVRTEIIRKTVNVYRRAHPHHATGTGPGGSGPSGASVQASSAGAAVATRTRASGTGGAGAPGPSSSAVPVLRTASSGSRSASGPSSPSTATQVRTRSSGAATSGGGGTSKSVSTRSSGGGEHDGSSHDDCAPLARGSPITSSARRVSARGDDACDLHGALHADDG